jgi:putative membrane protein
MFAPVLVIHWAVLSFAFWVTAKIVPGFYLSGFWDAIVVAAIFGVVNFFLGWLLFYGIGIATLGLGLLLSFLTHWFVNAILLKVTDSLTSRLQLRSFGTALIGALVMSFLGKVGLYLVNVAMHHSNPGSVYI